MQSTPIRAKMNAPLALLLCCAGSAVGYYAQPNAPYNLGPNDPYAVAISPDFLSEPSQRLFWNKWNNGQGSNQVGGTGLWATLTNKFPFLGTMFGRMELPSQYGPPQFNNQNDYQQYGAPGYQQPQYQQPQFNQAQPQFNQVPFNQAPQFNQVPFNQAPRFNQVPPQFYQAQSFGQQFPRSFAAGGRDVAITDDAVIVTPPHVPIAAPAPAPAPAAEPAPGGYSYNKPQYRLELPHK